MDIRSKILSLFYPVLIFFNKLTKTRRRIYSSEVKAPVSFYSLASETTRGANYPFSELRGKKVLIVNTASACGYTEQYGELQYLSSLESSRLTILAFPSADFRNQEFEDDESIRQFCAKYRVSFPLMKKIIVRKMPGQHPVFRWLTQKSENGWNDREPVWNFCKYLVDENGNLVQVFESAVQPEDIRRYL